MVVSSTILQARRSEVFIHYISISLQRIAAHVAPSDPHEDNDDVYRSTAKAAISHQQGVCFMGGDFN